MNLRSLLPSSGVFYRRISLAAFLVFLSTSPLTAKADAASGVTINSSVSAGSVTTTSAGTLILSGNNTYTGATTITNGTLQLSNTVTQGAANTVSVITGTTGTATGGTLVINAGTPVVVAGTRTLAGITFDSAVYNAATLTITSGNNLNGAGILALTGSPGTTATALSLPVLTVNGSLVLNSASVTTASAISFNRPINVGLVKSGAGTLVLANGTLYAGGFGSLSGVLGANAIVLNSVLFTLGSPVAGADYGTVTASAPVATGEANVLSNTQVAARGSFRRSPGSLSNLLKVRIEFGPDQNYGTIQPVNEVVITSSDADAVAYFTANLDWLQPGQTYHYRTKVIETIMSPGVNGGPATQDIVTSYGADRTFTMSAMIERGPVWCPGTPVTFNAVQIATGGNALLTFTPHLIAVTQGAHGATGSDGANVSYVPGAAFTSEDAIRVKVGFSYSGAFVFPAPTPPPSYVVEINILHPSMPVSITGAPIVGSNSDVQLNATFTANGPGAVASFEYGLDTLYGTTLTAQTLVGPSGTSILPSVILTGIQPGTTYHYRARIVNSVGESIGDDAIFATPAAVDGGTYVIDAGALEFDAFARIQVPWDMPTGTLTLNAPFPTAVLNSGNPAGTAVLNSANLFDSSSVITIGPGTKRVALLTGATHGIAVTDGTKITYTPGVSFTGSDTLLYRVVDPRLSSINIGQLPANVPFWVRVEIHTVLDLAEIAAVKGGSVPGSSVIFTTLGAAETGAFGGTFQNGAASVPAIFAADGSVKIKLGDPAPGLDGSVITKLSAPSGQAAIANLKIGSAQVTAANDCVLLAGLDATPRIAAREGQALSNDANLRIKSFGTFDGDGSVIFFLATLQGTGVTSTTDLALCAARPDGTVRLLLREGQNTAGIKTFSTLVGAPGSLAEGRWRAGDAAIGLRAIVADGTQVLCRVTSFTNSESLASLISSGERLADPPANAAVGSFGLPGFGPNGVTFRTDLAGSNDAAVAVVGDSARTILATKTGAVPDHFGYALPPEIHFSVFGEPVAGAEGRTAFFGTLSGPGITAANRCGIWYAVPGGPAKMLARTGDAARGGGHWASFISLALPDGPTSGPLFTGTLVIKASDGVTAKNNFGLWGVDSTGILRLLMRTGQSLQVSGEAKTIASFTALTSAAGSIGAAHGYDNAGHVSALLTFDDRTVAVVKLTVP